MTYQESTFFCDTVITLGALVRLKGMIHSEDPGKQPAKWVVIVYDCLPGAQNMTYL